MENELRTDNLLLTIRNRKVLVMNPKDRAKAMHNMERNLEQLVATSFKLLKQYEL